MATQQNSGLRIAAAPNGTIYVGGYFAERTIVFGGLTLNNSGYAQTSDYYVVVLDSNSIPVSAFSGGGVLDDDVTGIAFNSAGDGCMILNGGSFTGSRIWKFSGNSIWSQNLQCPVLARAESVAVDSEGNCYVTGHFYGTITFGSTTFTNAQYNSAFDGFVAKYDTGGNVSWAIHIGGSADEHGRVIATDGAGNCLVAGEFRSASVSFRNLTLTNTSGTSAEMFIVKLDSTGNPVWGRRVGGLGTERPSGIGADLAGNCYVAGYYAGTKTFGETNLPSGVGLDILLAKYDVSGNLRWARKAGGSGADEANGLVVRPNGDCYLTGSFSGNVAFGRTNLVSNGDSDVFAAKTDQDGEIIWAVQGGSTNSDRGNGITLDSSGNVYFTGFFIGAAQFGNTNLTNQGRPETFIVKLSAPSPTALSVLVQGNGAVSKSPDRAFYEAGEQVTLTAIPDRWFTFTRWGEGTTVNPRIITIGTNNYYTAVFSPTTAVETLTFGNVSRLAPAGMPAVFVDDEFIVTNSVTRTGAVEVAMLTTLSNGTVLYTLDGSEPSVFSRIYDGPFLLGRSALIRARAFDAFFAQSWEADPVQVNIIPEYGLNVAVSGGGTVGASPPAGEPFASNTLVTLTATPAAGWSFLQWLGDVTGTNASAAVVMNREQCVEAVFGTTFSNAVSGAGAVVVEPASAVYPYGTQLRLTAVPQAGHGFALWGGTAGGTNNPLVFTVTNSAPVVSAAFGALSAGQFSLAVVSDGFGSVTNSPRANRYNSGANVTLTATPNPGQQFLSWSGDAGGTQNPLTVTMSSSKVITAQFTRRPRLEVFTCGEPPDTGNMPLQLRGEFGDVFAIEASVDLEQWTPLATVTNVFGRVQWNDTTGGAQRFYRAVAP